ncbi:uncharacterized protein LOC131440702 isoform X2 [Malaya genurostris]|uniref:uncharacterized protein LOC131440702 isoform X2 n=1 Tax=Malaya genurostris TaxID=325434 RepID=UPI0026F3C93D|nr:uncharacterized protein LOC131440702 isoform X2 [Malaya genurostris]
MLPLSLGIGSIFIVLIGIVVNVYIILIISLTKQVLTSLGCGWLITILFGFPQLLRISPYYYDSYYELCLPNFKTIGSLLYNTSLTVFTVFLPIVLIFGCNMKVLMIARSQRHRIASAILEVTLSAQLTITHQRNPFFITSLYHPNVTNPGSPRINTHSPVSSIVQLVGSVITVYFPYYACILWNNLIEIVQREEQFMNEVKQNERALIPKVILQTATVLLLISPFVNALFYGIKNKHTRKTFHNIWRKQKSRIEIHYEIQARTPSTCGSRRPSITGANSTQPLLNKQLSETFLEISNADTNNKQSDNKLVSESRWTSNSRISNYSMLNSPTGDIENSTPRSLTSSEPNALELSAPGISVEPTKVTCTIRNAVKYYSSLSTNPKITITKTFSVEDPKSPKHEQLFSTATAEIKSVDSIETNDNLLLVGPTESFLETEIFNSILLTSKVQSSTFKKYSSLNDITRTAATICDILK